MRGDVEVATDIAAHAALMGFSVQLFETLAWAEELLDGGVGGRRAAPAPAVHRRRATRASPAGPTPPGATRTGPPSSKPTGATTRASPGYSMFIEALGQVYCGDLDRYVELTGEVAGAYGADAGYGLASYVDGLQSAGRVDEALALTEESVAAARDLGNPYWIAYALWIAGMAFAQADRRRALAAWDEGVAFVREHRVHFFEGFLARDAARLHTSDGEPEAALRPVRRGDRGVPSRRQRSAARHHAGQRAGVVRDGSNASSRRRRCSARCRSEPSSFHHVPELADIGTTAHARARAGRGLAELDRDRRGVRPRRRRGVRPAADRRRPARPVAAARPARPGGLSRREVEVLRLVAAGRTSRRDRDRAVHLDADRRAPHRQHLHEDRRLEPGRGDSLGRRRTASSTDAVAG